MRLPRSVDGVDLANHLIRRWGFVKVGQVGSHIKLQTDTPFPYTATIPAHKPMKTGMFAGIIRQIADHKRVTRDDILRDL